MGLELLRCDGGCIVLPEVGAALIDRVDGGNLIVNPPRDVWERSELSADELMRWSFLVAATGAAMLEVLPQLEGGCINYWEAGNWALNEHAEPKGFKTARKFRSVHLHLLGRSPRALNSDAKWGEAPKFPDYAMRQDWTAKNELLTPDECRQVIMRLEEILLSKYQFTRDMIKKME
ncbi:MAG: hypothetical protein ABI644_10330 [Arenimonas sp.]